MDKTINGKLFMLDIANVISKNIIVSEEYMNNNTFYHEFVIKLFYKSFGELKQVSLFEDSERKTL